MLTTNQVRDKYHIAGHYASVPDFNYAAQLFNMAKSEARSLWIKDHDAVLCYNEQSKGYDVYIVRVK